MSTPRHRVDTVETTSRAPVSTRLPDVDTPIYDALARELPERHAVGWPVVDPDPTAHRFPARQAPDGWFTPLPEIEHTGSPPESLFRSALVVTGHS